MLPDPPPLLTTALLDDLARRWTDHQLPLVGRLRPGVSDAEIRAAADELGFELPDEVKTWWRWHDGAATSDASELAGAWLMTPSFPFISLREAIAAYDRGRAMIVWSLENPGPGPPPPAGDLDRLWPRHWLPLTYENGWVLCDCSGKPSAPVPIRHMSPFEMPDEQPPRVRWLGELAALWIDAFDRPLWGYSPAEDRWEDFERNLTDEDRRVWDLL